MTNTSPQIVTTTVCKCLFSTCVLGAAFAYSNPTFAQDTAQRNDADDRLAEIVVTATRRSMDIGDVPLPVSVLDDEALRTLNASAFSDYYRTIPSVSIVDRGPGRNSIIIRGVSVDAQEGQITTSAVYVDESSVTAQFSNPDIRIVDLERIEFLKGPQGTLFGASSLGGAIRFITKKPNLERIEGYVEGTGRNTQDGDSGYEINGAVNFPIIQDTLAIRASGFYDDDGGYVDNFGSISKFVDSGGVQEPLKENTGGVTSEGVRAAIRWSPVERLAITGAYLYQNVEGDGNFDVDSWTSYRSFDPVADDIVDVPVPPEFQNSDGDYRQFVAGNNDLNDEVHLLTATVEYATNFADFTYAFTDLEHTYRFGSVSTGNPLLDQGLGFSNLEDAAFDTTAHEIRAVSNWDKRWHWIVGYYHQEDTQKNNNLGFGDPGYMTAVGIDPEVIELIGLPPEHLERTDFNGDTTQDAVFGEVTIDLLPDQKLQFTVGARYADWTQGFTGGFIQEAFQFLPGEDFEGTTAADFDQVPEDAYFIDLADEVEPAVSDDITTTKFNVAYRPTDGVLIFAQAAEGFRLAERGTNEQSPTCIANVPIFNGVQPAEQRSDTLWNYEIGARTQFADGKVSLVASVFKIDWTDIQFEGELPQETDNGNDTGCGGILPNGDAEITGFEFESSFLLSDSLVLTLNGAFTDAEVTKVPEIELSDGTTVPIEDLDVLGANIGTPLSVPDVQLSLGLNYVYPNTVFGSYQLFADASYTYTSSFFNNLNEKQLDDFTPYLENDDISLLNLSVGLVNESGLSIKLYIHNVTDERKSVFTTGPGSRRVKYFTATRPRTFGLVLRKDF